MRRLAEAMIAAVALGGCSMGADVKTADGGVAAFHQALNDKRFDAIYAGSAPEMKAAATPAKLTLLLSAIHRKLGPYVSGVRST